MKKSTVTLLFVVFAALLHSQTWPHPVFIRITAEGKVDQQTANNSIPCPVFTENEGYPVEWEELSTCTHGGRTDTVHDVRAGRSGSINFTKFTRQRAYSIGSVYPEDPQSATEVSFPWSPLDSVYSRNFYVHGWTCSNGGEYRYTVEQEWHLNRERQVTKVVVMRESQTATWRYSYFPDGRMKTVLTTGNIWGYYTRHNDTVTTEFLYNESKQCVAICRHSGSPSAFTTEAVQYWKQQLDSAFRNGDEPKGLYEYKNIQLMELVVYEYTGSLLKSTLAFNEGLSAVFSDSLFYNTKQQLIAFHSCMDESKVEMQFCYDDKGRLISRQETSSDRDNPDYESTAITESYTYGHKGRMSLIDYYYADDTYPNKVVITVYYPKDN